MFGDSWIYKKQTDDQYCSCKPPPPPECSEEDKEKAKAICSGLKHPLGKFKVKCIHNYIKEHGNSKQCYNINILFTSHVMPSVTPLSLDKQYIFGSTFNMSAWLDTMSVKQIYIT